MALPAGVTQLGTFKGGKGDTGSLAFATAETVPWTDNPTVTMIGPESARGAHFEIPLPLPGPETVNNDDATELLIVNPTKTSAALNAAIGGEVAPVAASAAIARRRSQTATRRAHRGALTPFALPAGFWDDAPIRIWGDGITFWTDFDVRTYRHTGGTTYYVDTVNGSGSNNGLSEGTAFPTVSQAHSVASDGDTIIVLDDDIMYRGGWNLFTITKSVSIIAANPGLRVPYSDNLTWSPHGTYPGVWSANRTNVDQVIDTTEDIDGVAYHKAASLVECAATLGSWWTDGTIVHVHRWDGAKPDNSRLFCLLGSNYMKMPLPAGDRALYLEGFEFYGGRTSVLQMTGSASVAVDFYGYDCGFHFTTGGTPSDGLDFDDLRYVFLQKCSSTDSTKDGINYGGSNRSTRFIEVDVRSGRHGLQASPGSSMNASTAHNAIRGIRLNGTYHTTMGGVVADAQTVKSVNFGCDAFDSQTGSGGNLDSGFSVIDAGGEMWLYGCRAFGSGRDIAASVEGATLHAVNTEFDTSGGLGTLDIVNAM